MRFSNFIVALSGVASVVSEVHDPAAHRLVREVASSDKLVNHLDARAKIAVPKVTTTPKVAATTTTSKAAAATTSKAAATTTSKAAATTTTAAPSSSKASASSGSTASSSSAPASSSSSAAAACPTKRSRITGRALEAQSLKAKKGGVWTVFEHEWVSANFIKVGDDIAVTDVSGCSPVFIWDDKDIPSVFHLFCGAEAAEAPQAATKAEEADRNEIVAATVAAKDQVTVDTITTALQAKFPGLVITPMLYDNTATGRKTDERYKFSAKAGSKTVTKTKIPQSDCSRQTQKKL